MALLLLTRELRVEISAPIAAILTGYFRGFRSLQANAGIRPKIIPRLPLPHPFQFHYTLIILPLDAVQSEPLIASSNKP